MRTGTSHRGVARCINDRHHALCLSRGPRRRRARAWGRGGGRPRGGRARTFFSGALDARDERSGVDQSVRRPTFGCRPRPGPPGIGDAAGQRTAGEQSAVGHARARAGGVDTGAAGSCACRPRRRIVRHCPRPGRVVDTRRGARHLARRRSGQRPGASRSAVRAALVYPCILALAGTISVAILVGIVLPRFAAILSDLGQTLPQTTRFVLQASVVARLVALPTGIATLIIYVVWRAWVSTASGAVQWDDALLAVPLVGNIRRSAATSRACAALSALLESGVPLPNALTHAAQAAGDAAIQERILAARTSVVAGARPSAALLPEQARPPPPTYGPQGCEETGALATMLAHAA